MTSTSWAQIFLSARWPQRLLLLGLVAAAVATLLVSGYAIGNIYSVIRAERAKELAAEAAHHARMLLDTEAFEFPFELKDISMPLTDRRQARSAFAQFNLVFDCPTAAAQTAMPAHRAKLLDAILEAGNRMTTNDFSHKSGFDTFKMHLKSLLEARLGAHAPRDVVVQSWAMN